jgi:hypothetical protein
MSGTASEYPGWEANDLGTLRLTIVAAGEHITQATVTGDPGTGLCRTHIRALVTANQLGRHDTSQERAVRKAEEFLVQKLRNLL